MRRDNRRSDTPVRQPHSPENDSSFAFRRSRTITGSAASNVRAAGEERGQLQSSRLHEHSLRKHRRRLLLLLVALLVASVGLGYVITSYIGGTVTVTTMRTQPLVTQIDTSRYSNLLRSYFADHPFERFYFAFNKDTFDAYMTQYAPEIIRTDVENGAGIGSVGVALDLREPVAAWTIENKQYYVDTDGVSFTVNYFATPTVVVSDKSGVSTESGVIASTKLLRFIGRVVSLVNKGGVSPVVSIELPANSTREVDLKLEGKSYIIKAHLDRDPAGQATDIINAVKYVELKGIQPAYLDVRVSSKAFYRDQSSQ